MNVLKNNCRCRLYHVLKPLLIKAFGGNPEEVKVILHRLVEFSFSGIFSQFSTEMQTYAVSKICEIISRQNIQAGRSICFDWCRLNWEVLHWRVKTGGDCRQSLYIYMLISNYNHFALQIKYGVQYSTLPTGRMELRSNPVGLTLKLKSVPN